MTAEHGEKLVSREDHSRYGLVAAVDPLPVGSVVEIGGLPVAEGGLGAVLRAGSGLWGA